MISIPKFWLVTQNSQKVKKDSIFVAIKGKKDGVDFIHDALLRGAKTIVVDRDSILNPHLELSIKDNGATLVRVENTRKALADLCSQKYDRPQDKLKIIGITGTKGKTTTTYLIYHILKSSGYKVAMLSGVKNYILDQELNSELTTPHADYLYAFLDTCVKNGVEYVVMEASAQGFSLHRMDNILFTGAIFTNLSQEHAEFYKTQQDYFSAKKKMFSQLAKNSKVIVNVDDEYGREIIKNHPNFVSVGYKNFAKFQIKNINTSFSGIKFDLFNTTFSNIFNQIKNIYPGYLVSRYDIKNSNFKKYDSSVYKQRALTYANFSYTNLPRFCFQKVHSNLIGVFNAYNIADAFLLTTSLGVSIDKVLAALSNFMGVPGRMECYKLKNGALGVVDYAHTPSSYQEVLSTLKKLTDDLIVVFGCGGERDASKRPVMGKIACEYADKVILTNDNPRSEKPNKIISDITANLSEEDLQKVFIELDREFAIKKAYALSQEGSIFVILGKGPDEYQIIGDKKYYFSDKSLVVQNSI